MSELVWTFSVQIFGLLQDSSSSEDNMGVNGAFLLAKSKGIEIVLGVCLSCVCALVTDHLPVVPPHIRTHAWVPLVSLM